MSFYFGPYIENPNITLGNISSPNYYDKKKTINRSEINTNVSLPGYLYFMVIRLIFKSINVYNFFMESFIII